MIYDKIIRRIAEIFLTDAVSSSEPFEQNEDATLKSLRARVMCWICYLRSMVDLFLTQPAIQFSGELQSAGSVKFVRSNF